MSRFRHTLSTSCVVVMIGSAILFRHVASTYAEQANLSGLSAEMREATVRYIALGTPDDLVRLQHAYEKVERELAGFQLDLPYEGSEQLTEKQHRLKGLRDRLGEAEAVSRLLDLRREQATVHSMPLQSEIADRMKALRDAIDSLETEVGSERAAHLRALLGERRGLAHLLSVQRMELLSELTKTSDCQSADQLCLHHKQRTLCRLASLLSGTEQLSILRLIAEVGGSTQCQETE